MLKFCLQQTYFCGVWQSWFSIMSPSKNSIDFNFVILTDSVSTYLFHYLLNKIECTREEVFQDVGSLQYEAPPYRKVFNNFLFYTFKSSSTGLTASPRPRKSSSQPSTLSWTLDEAELSSREGLNSTWDPVSSKRIVNIGSNSESWIIITYVTVWSNVRSKHRQLKFFIKLW